MGFEVSPPNEFRAFLRRGGGPLLADKKNPKGDPSAEGLEGVKMPRAEKRRADERGEDRHRLSDERVQLRHKGKTYDLELINLSHGGAMVTRAFEAKLWDKVALVLGDQAELECAVRWVREDRIGLEFAHETRIDCDEATRDELFREVIRQCFPDVQIKARPAPVEIATDEPAGTVDVPDQKRDATRHPLIWNGILHHDYEWQEVRLRNISATGALIECSAKVPAGPAVFLDLKKAGRIGAQVSWSRGNQMGLLFTEPFDVSCLANATPILASKASARPAPDGGEIDHSPWAPEWNRLSIGELGAKLGG